MTDLQVGLELLLTGLTVVFLVLFTLMIVMIIMSKLVAKGAIVNVSPPRQVENESFEQDVAAIMAVLSTKLPNDKQYIIKIEAR